MKQLNYLCLTCEYKGLDFIKACAEQGIRIYLVTSKKWQEWDWPREQLEDIFFMDADPYHNWNYADLILGTAHLMKEVRIDRIIALDDFDVEKAAMLREEFRIPGMGQTTARHFRDKLAMRMQAKDFGIPIPGFSGLFNDQAINEFFTENEGPWILKPRGEASASGLRKVASVEEAWEVINSLGDNRHKYLVEQFRPGDVYHVDVLSFEGEVQFSKASRYLNTPFEVAHGGGIFRSITLPDGDKIAAKLSKYCIDVLKAFGMKHGASHTEFIHDRESGNFYFLETSSRVGGANLAEMVEAATGINLWKEWARIESATINGEEYKMPQTNNTNAGIVASLSKYQYPDTSSFSDSEICWQLKKDHHIGFIVKSEDQERVEELLDQYTQRIFKEFHASAPAKSV